MSAEQLKQVRQALELSQAEMAKRLGLSGKNARHMVEEMEAGTRPITGPIQQILDMLTSKQFPTKQRYDEARRSTTYELRARIQRGSALDRAINEAVEGKIVDDRKSLVIEAVSEYLGKKGLLSSQD